MNSDDDDLSKDPNPETNAVSPSAKRLGKLWLRDSKPRAERKAVAAPTADLLPKPKPA